jgi:hypothetical protein
MPCVTPSLVSNIQSLTCLGIFDNQVIKSICHLRCFEAPAKNYNRYQHENLALRYLYGKTQTGYAKEHYITKTIMEVVDYIIQEMPELETCRDKFLYELCWCVIQRSGSSTIDEILSNYRDAVSLGRIRDCRIGIHDNVFAAAAYLGIMPLLQHFLNNPDLLLLRYRSDFGWPVNSAIAGGQLEVTELLLGRNFRIDEKRYPAFLHSYHSQVLQFLVNHVSEPSAATFRATILRATVIGDQAIVLDYMARLRRLALEKKTLEELKVPLHSWSATRGDEEGFQNLLNCILYVAGDYGHLELAFYAVLHGANTNSRPSWSLFDIEGVVRKRNMFSPLEIAAKRGYLDLVRYLLEKGAKPTQTALKQAARLGWLDVTRTLLDAGVCLWPLKRQPYPDSCEITAPNCGFYDFPEIVRRGHVDIVSLYLHRGFNKRTDKTMKDRAAEGYRIAQREEKREMLETMDEYVYDKETGKGWLRVNACRAERC